MACRLRLKPAGKPPEAFPPNHHQAGPAATLEDVMIHGSSTANGASRLHKLHIQTPSAEAKRLEAELAGQVRLAVAESARSGETSAEAASALQRMPFSQIHAQAQMQIAGILAQSRVQSQAKLQ